MKKKSVKLSKEEKALSDSIESGEWRSVKNLKRKATLKKWRAIL